MKGPITFHSPGVAVDRGAAALGVTLASLLVAVGSGADLFSSESAGPGVFLAFAASLITTLVGGAAVVQRRLDPQQAASPFHRAPAEVTLDGDTLSILRRGKHTSFARSAFTAGWIERSARGSFALLSVRGGAQITIEVSNLAEGQSLLGAVGVSAERQAMKTRLSPPFSRHAAIGCLALPVSIAVTLGVVVYGGAFFLGQHDYRAGLTFAGFLGAFALTLTGFVSPTLIIGNDGVTIAGLLHRRFVPWARVSRVTRVKGGVELGLRGGGAVMLAVDPRFTDRELGTNPVAQAIVDRIHQAMVAGGESPAAALAALDRGGRSLAVFREHLLALGEERSDYRRIALPREDILSVLDDPAAPPERRVAAALALSRVDSPEVKERVRIAVSACADEDLKRALSAAAEDELSEELLQATRRR